MYVERVVIVGPDAKVQDVQKHTLRRYVGFNGRYRSFNWLVNWFIDLWEMRVILKEAIHKVLDKTRSDILQGQALFRGVKRKKEKRKKKKRKKQ